MSIDTSLSSCSDNFPPELESSVVVEVDRVDETGIWGVIVDWGRDRCTAYLPMGSIGKEKGRGERKAQMHFLTRARRSATKKNDHRMTFVAFVQGVDAVSHSGVADCRGGNIGAQHFHITVTRRGITEEIEIATAELSRDLQRCARLQVDKAAAVAGVPRQWARKVTLHAAYERALMSEADDEPKKAPVAFLLNTIGSLDEGQASAVRDLFGDIVPPGNTTEHQIDSFASSLLDLCREEKQRRSQPVTFSVSVGIGGPKDALQHKGNLLPTVCDTRHVIAAFKASKRVAPPQGCDEATATVKGNGKFTLTTSASPELETQAIDYLNALSSSLQEGWHQSILSGDVFRPGRPQKAPALGSDLQPALSVGVIGDVANGKSTLVKAISGKRTQQHSLEQQQHGITIRLGFANASVLRCQNKEDLCGAYSFLPESTDGGEDAGLPTCSKCGQATSVDKRFSLVDCPGHAELMATMLAGASAFDAVLLAAASNVPCPTPQARQHLEALKMSGIIRNTELGPDPKIAIAQTKAELLADEVKNTQSRQTPEERLKNHAQHGRDNLRTSVAGLAPIFPVCAPLGLGLEAIAEWIANLPSSPMEQPKHQAPCLTVLRSFDVNFPGVPALEVSGGVLGGTIQGHGAISLGDELEVRPGLCFPSSKKAKQNQTKASPKEISNSQWLEKPKRKTNTKDASADSVSGSFKVQPLHFHCTSLMTGKTPLSSATKGGLVAVGTSLDPLICTDNRMVGSVAGPPGTLPPVWGPTIYMDQLQFVDLLPESGAKEAKGFAKPSDLLKKGAEIRFHIGSATAKGKVVRVSKSAGKMEARLDRPVCAARGANIALEGKGGNVFSLVAHAALVDGDVCLDGAKEGNASGKNDQEDEMDLHEAVGRENTAENELEEQDDHYRKRFLDDLESCKDSQANMGSPRISVPRADIARDGGAHVLLSNFGAIAHALRRESSHLALYLQKEGGLSCFLAGDRTSPATTMLRVKWRGGYNFAERFTSILKKYIRAYVTCNQCRGTVTELLGNNTEQSCRHCNARRFVPKL